MLILVYIHVNNYKRQGKNIIINTYKRENKTKSRMRYRDHGSSLTLQSKKEMQHFERVMTVTKMSFLCKEMSFIRDEWFSIYILYH